MINLIELCQTLIRFPSITPNDNGIMDFLTQTLTSLGFTCNLLPYTDEQGRLIHNLYARRGTQSPNLCFAGHVDVVPSGAENSWSQPPFSGNIHDGAIWGRGAVDMKGAIAAFISAVATTDHKGSISFLITGDEEGPATHGTVKVIEWLKKQHETIDFCIIGEPTSNETIGDTVKVGRRGSLSGTLKVSGIQGHVAYPDKAENPIPNMLKLLAKLNDMSLDAGYNRFQPSNLEITSVDVGNTVKNVIPETISANFNIRFNPKFTRSSLMQYITETLNVTGIAHTLSFLNGSEPFLTNNHPAIDKLSQVILETTGAVAVLSTRGGTSDARFIKDIAPVAEFGLLNGLAHKVDEHVTIKDLETLEGIYKRFIELYFTR
jgi:succinyl-diaminopimelate desuccinylase